MYKPQFYSSKFGAAKTLIYTSFHSCGFSPQEDVLVCLFVSLSLQVQKGTRAFISTASCKVCFVVITSSQCGSPLTASESGAFDWRNSTACRPPVTQAAFVWREIATTWQCSAGHSGLSPSRMNCPFFIQFVILFKKTRLPLVHQFML